MIILGVDYGYVRTGLAICDAMEILASPIGTIKETYMPKVADKIVEEANARLAELVVVGLPLNMDGSRGEHAAASEELAAMLRERGLKVELYDERLTTVEAYNLLSHAETYGKKRRDVVDTVSATIILEDFIKSRK